LPPKVLNNNAVLNEALILAIESSCDDTSAAVLRGSEVLSNVVADQQVHRSFGGVVPELASREHQKNIVPVVDEALRRANVTMTDLNAIAFTEGPGLMGSLLVGCSFAKSISIALNIPLIAVDHMRAHILAHFIDDDGKTPPSFPFLCLTVSGGHTQLVLVESPLRMKVVGHTIDDAAGEAFDKAAKILGLGYPGGPLIDKLAQSGNRDAFQFSTPRIEGLNFSFSGIKTSFLYTIQKELKTDPHFLNSNLNDICASYQWHVVNYLISRMADALKQYPEKDIALAGGVSANGLLRERFAQLATDNNIRAHIPKFEYCTDNAAMIGMVAQFKFAANDHSPLSSASKARLLF
jgi:N6-L-threonylcarbamoyladenine synthase